MSKRITLKAALSGILFALLIGCGSSHSVNTGTAGLSRVETAADPDRCNNPLATTLTLAEGEERARHGAQLFDLRHYQEAATEFFNAFLLTCRYRLLLNEGDAHRYAGNVKGAFLAYGTYLTMAPIAPGRVEVEQHYQEELEQYVKNGGQLTVGDTVFDEPEDSKTCELKEPAQPLRVTPDRTLEITPGELRFGVSVENRAPETVGVRRESSLAYPLEDWLMLTMSAVKGGDYRSLAGGEVYDLIGKTQTTKVCIPGGTIVRFANKIPVGRLRYFGAPEATVEWNLTLSNVRHHGQLKVVLPRRETLVLAIEFADVAAVKRLLSSGVDARQKDENGSTPLSFAIGGGHRHEGLVSTNNKETREIVTLLLDHGAPLAGALPAAGATDDDQLLDLLLARGADINETNEEGNSALHEAFRVTPPRREILRLLIERGANLHAKNHAGTTPLDLADDETRRYMLGIKTVKP